MKGRFPHRLLSAFFLLFLAGALARCGGGDTRTSASLLPEKLFGARYNGPVNGWDRASALAVDGAGNVYVTGASMGGGTHRDYVTLKYAPDGRTEWVASHNGAGGGRDEATALVLDTDGNPCVTGESTAANGLTDYTTIVYGRDGNPLWVADYDGPAAGHDTAYALATDASGHLWVTGESTGEGTGLDMATVRYDPDGTQEWAARYDGPASGGDGAYALSLDAAGNAYLAGYSWGGDTAGQDLLVVSYDAGGALRWTARYDGPGGGTDAAYAVAVSADGVVYVTGPSLGDGTDFDYATLSLDPQGTTRWIARYDGPAGGIDVSRALVLDGREGVCVTGRSQGIGTGYDMATVCYDPDGAVTRTSRFNGPGNGQDEAVSMVLDPAGRLFVAGYGCMRSDPSTHQCLDFDLVAVGFDAAGVERWALRHGGPAGTFHQATAVAADASGNLYMAGESEGRGTHFDYVTLGYRLP